MKKLLFLSALIVFTISAAQAQIKTRTERIKLQAPSKIIEPVPTEPKTVPPPPPTTNKSAGTDNQSTPIYALTSVRVIIKTGSDNKEFPSRVYAGLRTRSTPNGAAGAFSQFKLSNEMKINSDTEFGMERVTEFQTESKLDDFQSSGLKFTLNYLPNFFLDAWKIESITLVLEFKDQFGNLHPTLGRKTIVFSNAYGFLNNEYHVMECETDGSFAPLTALIRK